MWINPLYNTSKLTLELRDIVENGTNIWDFDYPSYYKGEEKEAFEKKVIDHYYFRQIGQETVGRFKHMFRTKMQEIMPYYVDMYKSVEIMHNLENPFDNVDVVETFEQQTSGSESGTASGQSSNSESSERKDDKTAAENKEHRFSNTPQGEISNLDSYMTEASVDDNGSSETVESTASGSSSGTSSQTSSSESSGTVKHTLTRKGNQGVNTFAHDIMEFRKSLINVDMMVINELNELFLGIY